MQQNFPSARAKRRFCFCNLHTVLDCPSDTFQGAGVNTASGLNEAIVIRPNGAPSLEPRAEQRGALGHRRESPLSPEGARAQPLACALSGLGNLVGYHSRGGGLAFAPGYWLLPRWGNGIRGRLRLRWGYGIRGRLRGGGIRGRLVCWNLCYAERSLSLPNKNPFTKEQACHNPCLRF